MAASIAPSNTATSDPITEFKDLTTRANHAYASKNYITAADLYSEATALQASTNGEMDPQNAELLFAYGRCLFHVGVSKSDVLGGKVASEEERTAGAKAGKKRKRGDESSAPAAAAGSAKGSTEEGTVKKDPESADVTKPEASENQPKPFFQITGDDQEWEDDSDSADDADADGEAEEEEDDLATAYEILDIARVLFNRQIEEISEHGKGKAKADGDDPNAQKARRARELLAETHDLQAEISLENERFTDAVSDSRASLALKKELYEKDKGIVAEAHFKLSLALEFASVTVQPDTEKLAEPEKEPQVDDNMRKEAADEMEAAIECTKLRLDAGMKSMSSLKGQELKERQKNMDEIKDIISDMDQRVSLQSLSLKMQG